MPTILRSWRIGSAFGIGIYVHASFFLLPVWVFFSNLHDGPTSTALYLAFLIILVFGCIILHELGHALMARHFGIPTRDITLYFVGGVARLERMSERPREEVCIALAGPAVNVVIGSTLLVLLLIVRLALTTKEVIDLRLGSLPVDLMLLNFLLALFNLIPAFPMDGGRVLRALLSTRLDRVRATAISAMLGLIFALLFLVAAVHWRTPGLMFLAVVLFLLGQQELFAVRHQARLRRQQALDLLDLDPDGEALPSRPAFSGFTWDRRTRLWIEWREGRPVHVLPE